MLASVYQGLPVITLDVAVVLWYDVYAGDLERTPFDGPWAITDSP